MNPFNLIQIFSQPHHGKISLYGRYGYIHISPERGKNTYMVECTYRDTESTQKTQKQGGYRLSTACCISACIIFGEQAVNSSMIELINTYLK